MYPDDVIRITEETGLYVVGESMYCFVDDSRAMTLDDVRAEAVQAQFLKNTGDAANFSYIQAAVWIRFTVENLNESLYWFLETDAFQDVNVWFPNESGNYTYYTGGRLKQEQDATRKYGYLLFRIPKLPDKAVIYIRYLHNDTMILHINLWKSETYITEKKEDLFFGIFGGIIIVMIVYNMLLFFILRDTSYLFYALFIFSMLGIQIIFSGIILDILGPTNAQIAETLETFFLALAIFSYIQFMRQFLLTRLLHPRFTSILNIYSVIAALHILFAFVVPYNIRTITISILFLAILPLDFTLVAIVLRKKYIPALFYLIAQLSLLTGSLLFVLRNFGFLPSLVLAENGMALGTMLETVLLSLGLAYRIYILQRQKQIAQEWGMANVKIAEKLKSDYRELFELNPLGIALFDREGRYLEVNTAYCQMYGFSKESFQGRMYHEVVFPQHKQRSEQQRFLDYIGKPRHQVICFERINLTAPGKKIMVKFFMNYTRDNSGAITGLLACCENTTRLKKVLKKLTRSNTEKDILLKEVHHRVKNNLQIMVSLFRIQSRNFTDPSIVAIFESTAGRIRTIANIHNRLYLAHDVAHIDLAEYIQSIVAQSLSLAGPIGSEIETTFDISQASLPVDMAIPLGLIINELVNNAVKHAFAGILSPKLVISLSSRSDEKNKKSEYTLVVRDNGLGLPADFNIKESESFGISLVMSLVDQLSGTCTIDRKGGTGFLVSFNH